MERIFKHKKTGEVAYYKDGVCRQGRFCVEIGVEPSSEFWEEIKEVILTTEDGVDLYNGDIYYFIWLDRPALGEEINKIYKAIVRPLNIDTTWSTDAVFFSTNESAEKYLKDREPKVLFTTQDNVD